MKTRQEMIYDFMLALAPSYLQIAKEYIKDMEMDIVAKGIRAMAGSFADAYLESLG